MRRQKILFVLKLLGTLLAGYSLVAWNPVNDRVIVPFTAAITAAAGFLLNVLGEGVIVAGTMITSPRFSVNVNNGCNGVEAMLVLLAAIIAFPAPFRARLAGLGLGTLIVQVLNQMRIVTLYLIGAHSPRFFDTFHTAVWQVVVIGSAMLFFVFWSARIGSTRVPTHR